MSNEMSMDEMIEVLARYRYNAKHDADRIKALEDELGRMRASSFVTAVPSDEYEKLNEENASLKAKIDELNQRWPNYHVDALIKAEAENARLKDENERLRKAGDEMWKVIWLAECIAGVEHTEKSAEAWNAAKEGKQS